MTNPLASTKELNSSFAWSFT